MVVSCAQCCSVNISVLVPATLSDTPVWDHLSSEEACLLVAAHLGKTQRPAVPKVTLPQLYPHIAPSEPRPWPDKALPGTEDDNNKGSWTFKDQNVAAHLIRNSIGRGDEERWQQLLSLKGVAARNMRDDQTVRLVI